MPVGAYMHTFWSTFASTMLLYRKGQWQLSYIYKTIFVKRLTQYFSANRTWHHQIPSTLQTDQSGASYLWRCQGDMWPPDGRGRWGRCIHGRWLGEQRLPSESSSSGNTEQAPGEGVSWKEALMHGGVWNSAKQAIRLCAFSKHNGTPMFQIDLQNEGTPLIKTLYSSVWIYHKMYTVGLVSCPDPISKNRHETGT